ncbi:M14 family zinc carboxypeptidase [candidate division KSB1 bacterium]
MPGLIVLLSFIMFFIPADIEAQTIGHDFLWETYEQYKISPENQAVLKHAELVGLLEQIRAEHPGIVKVRKVGESVEGRSINLVTIGSGPQKVFLWSQMHGNEPTATSALLDILNYMTHNLYQPFVKEIITGTTLLMIPMLNPDGAERFTRRNAQEIDINRDARYLQSPEGRTLKAVRDEYLPDFGFNLHDQGTRGMIGKTKNVAAISLLTPPFDSEDNDNETKIRAKKVAATFLQAIAPEAYGYVSKYDADFMPRAFGDMMQRWGVSTVLVESGGWFDIDRTELIRINFVGLLSVFHAIATDTYLNANPVLYDALRRSGEYNLFDLMVSEVTVINGRDIAPFTADIGVNYALRQTAEGPVISRAAIADIGDLQITAGKHTIAGKELVITPGFILFDPEVTPASLPSGSESRKLLQQGVTTIIGTVDMKNRRELELLDMLKDGLQSGVNIGFIGILDGFSEELSGPERDDLVYALTRGVLAVSMQSETPEVSRYLEWLGIPAVPFETLTPMRIGNTVSIEQIRDLTYRSARSFYIGARGQVGLGAGADLLLFEKVDSFTSGDSIDLSRLKYILFNGEIIYEDGVFTRPAAGSFIRN